MPFSPISVNSKTFNQAGDGRYNLSTLTFGNPLNYFNIKGASVNKDKTTLTGAVSRIIEKDVTVDGVTKRLSASVQLIITVPRTGFSSTDLDTAASDISEFLTSSTLDRILAGES